MVARANGYFGAPFEGHSGMTQRGPLYLTIFNVVVDAVLWKWFTVVAVIEGTEEPIIEEFVCDIQQLAAYFMPTVLSLHQCRQPGYSGHSTS